jgi:fucose permease
VAGQFIFGLVLALPGTLFGMPSWTEAVQCDVAAQANLLALFFAGALICTAAAGNLVDHLGPGRVLNVGTAVLAAGFVVLAGAHGPLQAAVGMSCLSAGGSAVNTSSNTLVSVTYGDRRGAMLSLMGVFTAVAACLTPLVMQAGGASTAARLQLVAGATAIVAIAPVLVAEPAWTSRGIALGAMLSLARDRALLAIIVLTAIEFGVEAVMAGWSAAYALAVLPAASGGAVVASYWGGLAAGRIGAPAVLSRRSKTTTVALGAMLTMAGVAIVGLARSSGGIMSGAFVAGLALGPLAPTLISVAGDRYPERTGLAIGAVISLGQIGGATLPWITGRVAIAAGFRLALVVPLAAALAIAGGATSLRLRRDR